MIDERDAAVLAAMRGHGWSQPLDDFWFRIPGPSKETIAARLFELRKRWLADGRSHAERAAADRRDGMSTDHDPRTWWSVTAAGEQALTEWRAAWGREPVWPMRRRRVSWRVADERATERDEPIFPAGPTYI
jgi:hypothetical protein